MLSKYNIHLVICDALEDHNWFETYEQQASHLVGQKFTWYIVIKKTINFVQYLLVVLEGAKSGGGVNSRKINWFIIIILIVLTKHHIFAEYDAY